MVLAAGINVSLKKQKSNQNTMYIRTEFHCSPTRDFVGILIHTEVTRYCLLALQLTAASHTFVAGSHHFVNTKSKKSVAPFDTLTDRNVSHHSIAQRH